MIASAFDSTWHQMQHLAKPGTCCRPATRPQTVHNRRIKICACAAPASISEHKVASGALSIQFLPASDVQGAGVLLTRAFSGTPEAVKLDEAVKFMREHIAPDGEEVTLAARLVPTDPSLLPPGKASRLVGTVSLSFSAANRETFASLAPPDDEAYLSNMAVDPSFRRQGIAKAMLAACDAAASTRGKPAIWLHVRQADPAAQQLYSNYGYQEVDRDKPGGGIMGLFGGGAVRPRILMKRQL